MCVILAAGCLVVGASANDDENGASLSDHASISAVFAVKKTTDFTGNTGMLTVTKKDSFDMFIKKVFVIFTDLFKALAHLDKTLEYLKG